MNQEKTEEKIKYLFSDLTTEEKAFICFSLIKYMLNWFDTDYCDYVINELCLYVRDRKEKREIKGISRG